MMTKGMELKNDDLMMVCGGNFGDAANDNNELHPLFSLGEEVQVYDEFLSHMTGWTTTAHVSGMVFKDGHWEYEVSLYGKNELDLKGTLRVTADDIQF